MVNIYYSGRCVMCLSLSDFRLEWQVRDEVQAREVVIVDVGFVVGSALSAEQPKPRPTSGSLCLGCTRLETGGPHLSCRYVLATCGW